METEGARVVDSDPIGVRVCSLMFWTDWEQSNPRIERCTLAGDARTMVFNVTAILGGGWPNGLTVDYVARRIYWIDAKYESDHSLAAGSEGVKMPFRGSNGVSHFVPQDI